jgi:hypothetical protein
VSLRLALVRRLKPLKTAGIWRSLARNWRAAADRLSAVVARSVSELLPRPFAEMTVTDVQQIVADVGEERETLFFERKRQVTSESLAKSCSAFANTYGGLLLVGIDDKDDELVGIDEQVAEPQVWVKDSLRGHVLPLPPFRTRWLPVGDDRGLLLVLVEESTSTPHLMTRRGTIYVRNPGSSDPVPIRDQARLLELFQRGERARRWVERRLQEMLEEHSFMNQTSFSETLLLAPTGVGPQVAETLFGSETKLQPLREALGDHEDTPTDARVSKWTQHSARVERWTRSQLYPIYPDRLDGIEVWRDGPLVVHRGLAVREGFDGRADSLSPQELVGRARGQLQAGFQVLQALGAHGDVSIVYHVSAGRTFAWPSRVEELQQDVVAAASAPVDIDDAALELLAEKFVAEIGRALGIGPDHPFPR